MREIVSYPILSYPILSYPIQWEMSTMFIPILQLHPQSTQVMCLQIYKFNER